MYLAFKWLIFMAVAMWVTLCLIDFYVNKEIYRSGLKVSNNKQIGYKNMTLRDGRNYTKVKSKFHRMKDRGGGIAFLHYLTFFAGALAVATFNRKTEIIVYVKSQISKINIRAAWEILENKFLNNTTAKTIVAATLKNLQQIWENFTNLNLPWIFKFRRVQNTNNLNHLLLMKIKEIGEERNKMGQLLLAAVHENKHTKLQYQLEVLAKNRVLRQVEEIHKQMKENRSRYITFQQMYLVTHQENTFLKARLKKIAKEKETAERNLMTLVNEIYRTKNGELRSFCNRFMVQSKDSIMNDDVRTEIQNFLLSRATASTSKWQISEPSIVEPVFKTNKVDNGVVHNRHLEDESLVPFMEEPERFEPEPKLRGLPGECVWTVKDKNGMIEKLYEYNFGYNFDNGDTIKRIREYSVYYDKDCLIDIASSRTVINDVAGGTNTDRYQRSRDSLAFPSNHRFLTGSEAFQRFLQDNTNIITPVSSKHRLLYA